MSVDENEFSIFIESELLVESSLFFWIFRNVSNLPSLVDSSVLLIANDSLSFLILTGIYIEYLLVGWVLEEGAIVLPDLPPGA